MNTFSQVMRKWHYLCVYMDEKYGEKCCDCCPLSNLPCGAIYEQDYNTDWDKIEEAVEAWSKTHPMERYPTWAEWLDQLGILSYENNTVSLSVNAHSPIPKEIAQNLKLNKVKTTNYIP